MPPSDLRRPARGRGPARGQVAAWSVLPAAAVVIIVGGLFWASVWIVFRSPSTRAVAPSEPSELIASSDPIDADVLPIDEANASDDGDAYLPDDESVADESDAEYVAQGPGSADDQAYFDTIAEERAQQLAEARLPRVVDADVHGYGDDDGETVAYAPGSVPGAESAEVEAVAYGPSYAPGTEAAGSAEDDDLVAVGPIYGPPLPDHWDGMAVASADGGQTDEGIVVDIAARAAELTAKAEELTSRIEGLTMRMEELQSRIEVSGTILAAVPSPVPSPGPTIAQTSGARQSAETVTVRNNVQAPVGGRAPWVILPQPAAGSRVAVGPVTLEARARGEAPITKITFQLDGTAVPAALDRRDETTWRGQASVRVSRGSHTVTVFVVDEKGRTGSYRWELTAGP